MLERNEATDEDALLRDQLVLGLRTGPVRQELQRLLRRDERLTFQAALKEARILERELDSPPAEAEAHAIRTQIVSSDVRGGRKSDLDDLRESLKSELRDELAAQLKTLSSKLVEELRNQSPICGSGS